LKRKRRGLFAAAKPVETTTSATISRYSLTYNKSVSCNAEDRRLCAEALDPLPLLREQAMKLFGTLLEAADQPTLVMLCPLLARLAESPTRRR
jgi:hypothetical protein